MKTIHHVLDIDASPTTVWAALIEPAGLTAWWSTNLAMPPAAVGVRINFTFLEGFNPVMQITLLESQRELLWRCVGGHDPWMDNEFRFELSPSDGRTRLRFWQEYAVELDDDAYGSYNFNWGYYLESLRLYCGQGAGKPFQA